MNGLVLIGGRSTRMGADKSLLCYHQKPQWQHTKTLLEDCCERVYVCGRAEQYLVDFENNWLLDSYATGPLGGILTAFEHDATRPWLVMACDMPFVTHETLTFLQQHRDPTRTATAFQNPITHLPEPLLTIWEPAAFALLKQAHDTGRKSPMYLLKQADVQLLSCPQPRWLQSLNSPEEVRALWEEGKP
ncbi:MAG: NTP transferase domain-containing protein [Spirosomaceae bacterium]|nr:NTP transferase domain-containing protein [Spirosomataceae bacterium]